MTDREQTVAVYHSKTLTDNLDRNSANSVDTEVAPLQPRKIFTEGKKIRALVAGARIIAAQSRNLDSPPWLFHADSQPIQKEPPSLNRHCLLTMATVAKHDDIVGIERRSAVAYLFDMIKIDPAIWRVRFVMWITTALAIPLNHHHP